MKIVVLKEATERIPSFINRILPRPLTGFHQLNPACALRALAIACRRRVHLILLLSLLTLSLSRRRRFTHVPLSAAVARHVSTPLQRDPRRPRLSLPWHR